MLGTEKTVLFSLHAVDKNQGNGYTLYTLKVSDVGRISKIVLQKIRMEWKLIWMLNRMTTYGDEENSQFLNLIFSQFCQIIVQRRRCNQIETLFI